MTRTNFVIAGLVAGGLCGVVHAQSGVTWEVRILHPTGLARSEARSVDRFGTVTGVGEAVGNSNQIHGYWGSTLTSIPTAASWTPLSVFQGLQPEVAGMGPETAPGAGPEAAFFYGHARLNSRPADQNPVAGVWNRATGTFTSMNPSTALWSRIYGAKNGQQVGELSGNRAALWRGTASSSVLLHPSAALASRALACDGVRQVGYADFSGQFASQAVAWSGNQASMIVLHQPAWWTSWALDVEGDQVVGFKRDTVIDSIFGPSPGLQRPMLWRGTGNPPIDLMPAGPQWLQGTARGVVSPTPGGAGIQVGSVSLQDNSERAVMWRGTAASMLSLHDLLPANASDPWQGSIATAIAGGGVKTYIVGYAWGISPFNSRAVMWIRTDSTLQCGPSDVAGANQSVGPDGRLTADDIIVYLGWFFSNDPRADVAGPNQAVNPDGVLTPDDIIVFLQRYFAGC